ncbi:MAG: Rpn family recombination-promoting nuclease/putative transposase, partial [Planctomycetaceae bacterium]|nr:Rpn family recombination-promoting nuclease/putative transposase [Planctomycetaceae bacterium]
MLSEEIQDFELMDLSEIEKAVATLKNKYYRHDPFNKRIFGVERGKKLVNYVFRDKPEILSKLDVDNLQLGQTSFTDKKLSNRTVDIHYVIPLKNETDNKDKTDRKDNSDNNCVVSILIELKAQNSWSTILQMVIYIVNIWESLFRSICNVVKGKDATVAVKKRRKKFLLPMVIPVILYQGRKKFSAPTKLSELIRTIPGLESHSLDVEALLVDLSCLRVEDEPDDLDLWVPFRVCRMV